MATRSPALPELVIFFAFLNNHFQHYLIDQIAGQNNGAGIQQYDDGTD